MSEIPKAYEPQSVEDKWYDFWLKHNCFTADPRSPKPAYSIVIPPPNVTGVLHMGHVLNNTIQDILSRKARMDGKEVLWLPGTDHAGIATEGMVAKKIWKEEKQTKRDLGREEFLKRVWDWKEKHGGIIIAQLKKLGCSCDWTRERFTMDPDYVPNVQRVFVDLYKKGLIYRGKRMVNWCPATQTALSDEEVEMRPQKGFMYHFKVEVVGQASRLSQTSKDKNGDRRDACPTGDDIRPTGDWLTIATTRPETIPGDTAVAVNPKDPRYAKLIGKFVVRPLPPELPREKKLIPIIGDEHVDFEFGTGVLKVTPAHDRADYDIGLRHKLPVVDIMNPDGSMNELAGADLKGLDRFIARKVAVEKLTEVGAFVEEKPYENNIGFSQRADVPIEPRLSEQWFLKYPSVEKSKACVAEGRMKFHPERWAKVYDHWLTNIQDWCISRQLWWGHRIPVWTKTVSKSEASAKLPEFLWNAYQSAGDRNPSTSMIFVPLASNPGEKTYIVMEWRPTRDSLPESNLIHVSAASEFPAEAARLEEFGFTQDPDVLDTWFSSWLWPFATMGWTNDPETDAKNETLKKFYPTTDLVTAPEIIFFWVARMIMAGYEYMGDLPFRNVYFNGIVRDKQGRKMAKQLGNSPNPLDLIAKYGADAIRFGTMRSAPLGQDVLFDEKDVELGRNFCNKLWNACRFRQLVGQASRLSPSDSEKPLKSETGATPVLRDEVQGEINPRLLTTYDKWILLKLDLAIREITTALNEYKFNEAAAVLYRFFWSEYCDWYVEASKAVLVTALKRDNVTTDTDVTLQRSNDVTQAEARRANTIAVIDFVLSHTLRLFHPFLPFITEELWHGMGYAEDMPENQGGKTILNAPWPKPLDDDFKGHYGLDDCYLEMVDARYDLVTQGRNLRRTANIPAGKKVKYIFKPAQQLGPHDAEVLKLLLNAETFEVNENYQPPKGTPTVQTPLGELCLPLEGQRDVAAEKTRLTKELEKIAGELSKVEQKLANPNFVQKVPPQVLQEHQQRLAEWKAKLEHTQNALQTLEG